jgi:hypothetical protein
MEQATTAQAPAESLFQLQMLAFHEDLSVGGQSFHAYKEIHIEYARNKATRRALDSHSYLWAAMLSGLETATFMALSRIFDDDAPRSISKLLSLAMGNLEIFSKERFEARLRILRSNTIDPESWVPERVANAYVPTREDFKQIKRAVAEQRSIFTKRYLPIRNKWYAHREMERREVRELFREVSLTSTRGMLDKLSAIDSAIHSLYFHAKRPDIEVRSERTDAHMLMELEVKKFFKLIRSSTDQ